MADPGTVDRAIELGEIIDDTILANAPAIMADPLQPPVESAPLRKTETENHPTLMSAAYVSHTPIWPWW